MREKIKEIIGNLIPAERKIAVLKMRGISELCDDDLISLRTDLAVAEAELWQLQYALHKEQTKYDR